MPTYTQILTEAKIRRFDSPRAKPTFRSLEDMLKLFKESQIICCIEEPFGIPSTEEEGVPRITDINYGHVVGAMNAADKNEWDIIFPGSTHALNLVVCDEVIGYVHSADGNHKLIGIAHDLPGFTEDEFERQLKKYVQKRRNSYDEECHAKLFKSIGDIRSYTEY